MRNLKVCAAGSFDFAPLRMTRDRALWRGELCESAVVQSSALRSWSSSDPRVPYNRTLSTAFAAIQPR